MTAPAHIAGTGLTRFGTRSDRTSRDLFGEAAAEALADAGVPRADVDAVYYGNFVGARAERQGHQGPLAAEAAGVTAPATRVESACASGGFAVRQALLALRSGAADCVLVGGAERLSHLGTGGATESLATAADDLYETRAGMTFPGAYALMARAYLDEYGGSREDLAHVAVKNHDNALPNDHAHLRTQITVEDVLSAPTVADPLGLYDACPISDGAAALVLTTEAYAEDNDLDAAAAVTGSGQGGDFMALQDRDAYASTPAAARAAETAYAEAGVTPDDVAAAEVHDCFTIAEVLALEALGFYAPGEAIGAARRGETTRDGDLPVNLSGGLKAKGHPVGATGAAQLVALARLHEGTHPRADALAGDVTVAHNAGGTVASAVVHVVEAVR